MQVFPLLDVLSVDLSSLAQYDSLMLIFAEELDRYSRKSTKEVLGPALRTLRLRVIVRASTTNSEPDVERLSVLRNPSSALGRFDNIVQSELSPL